MKTRILSILSISLIILILLLPMLSYYNVEYHEIERDSQKLSENNTLNYQSGFSNKKEVFLLLWTDTASIEVDIRTKFDQGETDLVQINQDLVISSEGLRIFFPEIEANYLDITIGAIDNSVFENPEDIQYVDFTEQILEIRINNADDFEKNILLITFLNSIVIIILSYVFHRINKKHEEWNNHQPHGDLFYPSLSEDQDPTYVNVQKEEPGLSNKIHPVEKVIFLIIVLLLFSIVLRFLGLSFQFLFLNQFILVLVILIYLIVINVDIIRFSISPIPTSILLPISYVMFFNLNWALRPFLKNMELFSFSYFIYWNIIHKIAIILIILAYSVNFDKKKIRPYHLIRGIIGVGIPLWLGVF